MNKGKKLYEGKAKILYETKDKNLILKKKSSHKKKLQIKYLLIKLKSYLILVIIQKKLI